MRRREACLAHNEDPRATILALGNVGVLDAVTTIAVHAADPDRAVATALGNTPDLVAHEALSALMADTRLAFAALLLTLAAMTIALSTALVLSAGVALALMMLALPRP